VSVARSDHFPDYWFALEVLAEGNHLKVKVNGTTTAEHYGTTWSYSKGHVALQQLDPDTRVEFRTIEIEELNGRNRSGISDLASQRQTGSVPEPEAEMIMGTTAAARPELAGVELRNDVIDFEIRSATGNVVFAGKIEDTVRRSWQRNTVEFEFRIRNTKPGLPGQITEVRREGFGSRKTDMDYRLDGLGTIGPDRVMPMGAAVGFSFGKRPLRPGDESRFCFVLTDATEFDAQAGSLVIIADDGSKATLRVAAPKK
jgi:hypothetical protein